MNQVEKLQKMKVAGMFELTSDQLIECVTSLDVNRDINTGHIAKLKAWLKQVANEKTFNSIPPILIAVDPLTGKVYNIDGNHRQEAIKQLLEEGITVVIRAVEIEVKDFAAAAREYNNSQRNWRATDYLRSFVKSENESYLILKDFMDTANATLIAPRGFATQQCIEIMTGKFPNAAFREGKLHLSQEDFFKGSEYVNELYRLQSLLKQIRESKVKNVIARGATAAFYSLHSVDGWQGIDDFLQKVAKHPELISDNTECAPMLVTYKNILNIRD